MSSTLHRDIANIGNAALAMLAGFGGRLVARILLVAIAVQFYGTAEFGRLGVAVALIELLAAFAAMGFKRTLHAQLEAVTDNAARRTAIFNALLLVTVNGVCLAAAMLVIWNGFFGVSRHFPLALGLGIPLIAVTDVALAVTKFNRKIVWEVAARGLVKPWSFLLFLLIGMMITDVTGGEYGLSLLHVYGLSLVATALIAVFGMMRNLPDGAAAPYRPKYKHIANLLTSNAAVGLGDTGTFAFRKMDILLLGLFAEPEVVGVYYMAQQVATVAEKIRHLFEPMIAPALANAIHGGRHEDGSALANAVSRWTLYLQLVLLSVFVVLGGPLLGLFHEDFAVGALVLATLVVAEIFDGATAPFETYLLLERPNIPPMIIGITILAEFLLIGSLAPAFGAVGAAAGLLGAMLLLAIMRVAMHKRIDRARELRFGVLKPMIAFSVATILGLQLSFGAMAETALELAGLGAALVTVFASVFWILGIPRADRALIVELRKSKSLSRP